MESSIASHQDQTAGVPPRDPDEDQDGEDEGGDEDEGREPAVIREPDENQSRRARRYSRRLTGAPLRRGDDRTT